MSAKRRICAQCGKVEPTLLWLRPGRMFKIWKGASHKVDLCSFECSRRWYSAAGGVCQGADFSRPMAAIRQELERHCQAHGYTGPFAAVFLARGGHAPGQQSLIDYSPPEHEYWCEYPDRDCICPPRRGSSS